MGSVEAAGAQVVLASRLVSINDSRPDLWRAMRAIVKAPREKLAPLKHEVTDVKTPPEMDAFRALSLALRQSSYAALSRYTDELLARCGVYERMLNTLVAIATMWLFLDYLDSQARTPCPVLYSQ